MSSIRFVLVYLVFAAIATVQTVVPAKLDYKAVCHACVTAT